MNLIKALLAPSLRTENKGLKEMRAWTRRERGVSPTHLGRSSFPSSYPPICTNAATWTAQCRPLGGRAVGVVALPLREITAERFWSGNDRAIVVLCVELGQSWHAKWQTKTLLFAMLRRTISSACSNMPRGIWMKLWYLLTVLLSKDLKFALCALGKCILECKIHQMVFFLFIV